MANAGEGSTQEHDRTRLSRYLLHQKGVKVESYVLCSLHDFSELFILNQII